MSTAMFRLLLVTCAVSWFLVGMHSPVFHEMLDHGAAPHWPVLVFLVAFVVTGAASFFVLLRLRPADGTPATSAPRTT